MFITPSFKKSLIVEQFQGNYLNRSGRGPSFFEETMLKHRQMKNTVTFNDGKDITME